MRLTNRRAVCYSMHEQNARCLGGMLRVRGGRRVAETVIRGGRLNRREFGRHLFGGKSLARGFLGGGLQLPVPRRRLGAGRSVSTDSRGCKCWFCFSISLW